MFCKSKIKLKGKDLERALKTVSNDEWRKLCLLIKNKIEKRRMIFRYNIQHILSVDDLIQEAITRLFEGRRSWDGNKNNLFKVLYYETIRGMVWQTKNREMKKSDVISIFWGKNPPNCDGEHNKTYSLILKDIQNLMEDDEIIIDIMKCILFGNIYKPEDLMEATGYKKNKINNGLKRLRNKFKNNEKLYDYKKLIENNITKREEELIKSALYSNIYLYEKIKKVNQG